VGQGICYFVLEGTVIFIRDQNTGVISKKKNTGKFIDTSGQVININNKKEWSQNRSLSNSLLHPLPFRKTILIIISFEVHSLFSI
jgi:hypothetical protein